MDCWCSTNEKEKTKAIELGTSRINELEALLGETIAKIKELKSKRKSIQEEQYKDQAALDEAEELRMKENKEFHVQKQICSKQLMQPRMPSLCSASTTQSSHRSRL